MKNLFSIGFDSPALEQDAQLLASRMMLNIDNTVLPRLQLTQDKLVLLTSGFSPLFADFNRSTIKKRHDAGKKQGLIRACKPSKEVRILDATAGWGRDASILASFGADVLMLERNPIMAALLEDALQRVSPNHALKLSLKGMDAMLYLDALKPEDYPDIIYIDPMHPARQKSALVKKDMQVMQQLIGPDEDAQALIKCAISKTRQRVVVKWPQRLQALLQPNTCIEGKTVRFDIYLR